jgi:hypothetical protein
VIVFWLVVGGLVGLANDLTRRWSVSRLRQEMRPGALAVIWGGLVLRLGLVTALLIVGLKRGIVPGLLAFSGLWLARWGTVIWHGAWQGRKARRILASSCD